MADRVMKLASERAVVVFTLSSCCMCHTVAKLMQDLSVNALVHELDSDPRGKEMERALLKMLGGRGPASPPSLSAASSSAAPTGSCPFTSAASWCPCSRAPARSGSRDMHTHVRESMAMDTLAGKIKRSWSKSTKGRY